MRQRHNERWNILFCDGHVENLRTRELFSFRDDAMRQRWNKDHQAHREFKPSYEPFPEDDPSRQ